MLKKRKFNYFNTAKHNVVKEMRVSKQPVTNGDTGKIENPPVLKISASTLTNLKGLCNAE